MFVFKGARFGYFSLILGFFISSVAFSQNVQDEVTVYFKSGQVVPVENSNSFLISYSPDREHFFCNRFYKIIQFYQIPGQSDKQALADAGVVLLDYLPNHAYFASFDRDFKVTALTNQHIRSITDVSIDYKLAPILLEEDYPDHALRDGGQISLTISYYRDLPADEVVNALQGNGISVTNRDDFGKVLSVSIPITEIRSVAALPFVVYVEPVQPDPEPDNYTGTTLHHTNALACDYPSGRHYDGSGVHVMLQDDGVIGPHIDYAGRIGSQFITSNNGNHGDHCAGIIMGAGNIDPLAKGNAPGSAIYVYGASPSYPGFSNIPVHYATYTIRVTSTSYSDGCNAGYTSLARTLDQQVRTYPSLMHVFSAGNSGSENCGYGAGAGWGNVTGGHKIGKNVIAVANVNYMDELSSSSSRGPAHDGRIKPDLAAKGSSVYSTIDPNDYSLKSGTSMSCPGVSGTVASLFQAYRMVYGDADPMAGLLKGILLNTADDLGNPGPDFKFGWGRVNALQAVQVIEEGRFDSGTINQGQTLTHQINVPQNTAQLRVMVYWTDYEAALNASIALVNNINITLTGPGSITWNPWVLNHYPHPDSLNLPAVRGTDNRNNVEQVTLNDPAPGNHTLQVNGFAIPQGPQTYYVMYEFIPNEAILTYPIGGESWVPGETEVIRWDAAGNSETFSLLFSLDNGQTWDTIAADLPGNTRHYSWVVTNDITGTGLIKVIRAESSSQCEEPVSIIGVPCDLRVDWACDDAVHLSWSAVNGATSYEIFRLGEKYMDSVGTTSQQSFLVEDPGLTGTTWFSIRALGENGTHGRRAVAIEKPAGTFNCFPVDAKMVAVPSVDWGVFQSFMDLTQVKVVVEIKNFGKEPITGPGIYFQLDNGPLYSETYSGSIPPDSTLNYSFSTVIDISGTGNYLLKAWVDYPLDQNPANDLVEVPIEVIEGIGISFGYNQSFDNWETCSTAPICELYACPFPDGWLNLSNELYDQHDWRIYKGTTPTSGTGPTNDHTTGTSAGKFIYMEPSVVCFNREAVFTSPCLDLTNGVLPTLHVWYHAYGADIGQLHTDLFTGSEVIRDVVSPVIGNKGNEWKEMEIDLSPWNGQIVALRFRGMTACGQKGDLAIDDITIGDITSPDQTPSGISNRFLVYPNPASNKVSVQFQHAGETTWLLQLTDLYGRILNTRYVTPVNAMINEVITLPELVPGLYLIQLKSEGLSVQKKLSIR